MPSPSRRISHSVVRRISFYLRALEELEGEGRTTVSSRMLADRVGSTAPQVRKDLSLFGSFGKRGLGYAVGPLADHLREILGLKRRWRVALVGAGRIGAALFGYPQLRERGFQIVTILDNDPAKIGTVWNGVVVRSAASLEDEVRRERVEIAILAVPAGAAQAVAESLVRGGVRGILNFAPARIRVDGDVAVHGVNMAVELETLAFALSVEDSAS